MKKPNREAALRVLHVIPSVSPYHGGPSEALRHMTKALTRSGVHIEVATTTVLDEGASHEVMEKPVQGPRVDGAFYHVFLRRPQKKWSFSRPLAVWLRTNAGRYDLVHVHAVFCFPSYAAARAARKAAVPYIVRPCGMLDPWPLRQKSWRKKIYYHVMERPALRAAAAIHCTSPSEAASLRRLGYAEKVRILPLGVPVPPRHERRRPRGDSLRILFLSRLHPKKGLPVLLEALAILRNEHTPFLLHVAGTGAPAYEAELRQRIARLRLRDRVELVGFVSGRQKQLELANADLFVLPSYHENMGLAVVEAMASGLPVVITDQVAFSKDILEANAGSVVPVDSPEALAGAVRAYREEEKRMKTGRNAREFVEARFTREGMARALVELYGGIVSGGSPTTEKRQERRKTRL